MNLLLSIGATVWLMVIVCSCLTKVDCYPTASVSLFSNGNKLEDKLSDENSEQSFQQFIQTKPDSVLIGQLKPNASQLDMMLLKKKIASTILSMQELENKSNNNNGRLLSSDTGSDCFIEVTRVERVPGKCHKVNNGLPICQSENYMAINSECN